MASPHADAADSPAEIAGRRDDAGRLVLTLGGRLDSDTTGAAWREAMRLTEGARSGDLVVDAAGVEYCDGAGAGLLLALQKHQQEAGGTFVLDGLRDEFQQLLALVSPALAAEAESHEVPRVSWVQSIGRATLGGIAGLRELTVFVGELTVMLLGAIRRPSTLRAKDVFLVAERAGIGAIPIIALVGFLLGLILSFQSAIPMQRFGAQVFVADLLGISLLRELGPLMAAILLAARSGSAFAAELGTMKINEEVDALTTMGLEPVRFLVVPRVVAAVVVVPVLAMIMNVAGLIGGAVVFLSLQFPLVTYVNRIVAAASVGDFLGGLFKAIVFGIIVAGVGCLRGLQTGSGAGAVGQSTTSSVVSGIVLIAIVDGVFAVAFYVLGI
jgi:phospholipid/cholesterol/gamma-HCH transport system permease protein